MHTVQVIEVDEDPIMFYDPEVLRPEYADLPADFAAALRKAVDSPDDLACAYCGSGIGYRLAGDRDEALNWHWVGLVQVPPTYYPEAKGKPGGPVVLLCEDCVAPLMTVVAASLTT